MEKVQTREAKLRYNSSDIVAVNIAAIALISASMANNVVAELTIAQDNDASRVSDVLDSLSIRLFFGSVVGTGFLLSFRQFDSIFTTGWNWILLLAVITLYWPVLIILLLVLYVSLLLHHYRFPDKDISHEVVFSFGLPRGYYSQSTPNGEQVSDLCPLGSIFFIGSDFEPALFGIITRYTQARHSIQRLLIPDDVSADINNRFNHTRTIEIVDEEQHYLANRQYGIAFLKAIVAASEWLKNKSVRQVEI